MEKIRLKNNNLKVQYISISSLKPAPYNPRRWDDKAIVDLKESIKRYGLVDPIIVNSASNRKNVVIGGHFRLKVVQELGFKTIPVVYVNISSLKKEKELNLRLNRNQGEWDFELLKDFDIDLLLDVGFNDSDLSHIWDENLGVEDDEFNVEKELEKIKTPKVKAGEMYLLGDHKLICGDATNPDIVHKLAKERTVSMIYCDPPFNIALDYNNGIGTKGKYGGEVNDRKSNEEYKAFIKKSIQNALSIARPDCHLFYYCDEKYIGLLQELYRELGVENKRVCLWIKNNQNVTPQTAFNKCYEACIYGIKGNPYLSPNVKNLNEVLNKEVGTGNRTIDDILDLFNIWLVKRLPAQEYEHPTEKPPTLHEKPLRRCTKPGDVVLDLFGGSGSTLIACEHLKRRCLMAEIEPIFCNLIIRRFKKLTGKEAKHVG